MKAITNIQLITQKLAARLYTAAPTRADKQRGASALEYIVLAAAIVVALVLASTIFSDEVPTLFQGLFDEVPSVPED
ncbi:MAG: hypothetical protein CL543_07745 [Alcanivorax sp.]|nr:hypothetical protein [Alcanivorax sp.]